VEIVSKGHGSIIQPYIVIKGDSLKPYIKSIMTNDLQRLSIPILFDSEYAFYNHYEMSSELLSTPITIVTLITCIIDRGHCYCMTPSASLLLS
jgi:hypothetical protein